MSMCPTQTATASPPIASQILAGASKVYSGPCCGVHGYRRLLRRRKQSGTRVTPHRRCHRFPQRERAMAVACPVWAAPGPRGVGSHRCGRAQRPCGAQRHATPGWKLLRPLPVPICPARIDRIVSPGCAAAIRSPARVGERIQTRTPSPCRRSLRANREGCAAS